MLIICIQYIVMGLKLIFSHKEVLMLSACDADDDDEVISIYHFFLGKERVKTYIMEIAEETNDNCNYMLVAEYAMLNNLCEYLPILERRLQFFSQIPPDTTWRERISSSFYRISSNKSSNDEFKSAPEEYLIYASQETKKGLWGLKRIQLFYYQHLKQSLTILQILRTE